MSRNRWPPSAAVVAGMAALAVYLVPGLGHPAAYWPLWDMRVYWCGGQRVAAGAALYAPGACRGNFTYPPFAAQLFSPAIWPAEGYLAAFLTAASVAALLVLCWLSLARAGIRPRPQTVFLAAALASLTVPVRATLHLGETDLILAALVAADLLRRGDGGWWQGVTTGLAAGIKLTPLIFVVYLAVTGRVRAAATSAAAFAVTVAAGFLALPGQSQRFWLAGVFFDDRRIGNPANPSNQSLSGALARLAGHLGAALPWWYLAAALTGLAGIAIAAWAHRRGYRLAGVICCAITGLLISPISWTHHWVSAVPLLIALTATATRRRSPGYGVAAAVTCAVFSGLVPLREPGSWRLPAAALYVLCGLAVLAGTAFTLTRSDDGAVVPGKARAGPSGAPAP